MINAIGTAEAAKRLGLTSNQVRNLCKRRVIRAKQIGRNWLMDPADVEAAKSRPDGRRTARAGKARKK